MGQKPLLSCKIRAVFVTGVYHAEVTAPADSVRRLQIQGTF